MPSLQSLEQLTRLYAEHGGRRYGEHVTQLEHALQCAALAQAQGSAPALVAAALLHDVGHLFEDEGGVQEADHRHEAAGALALSGLFGPEVCKPVALHVAAKRWLCLREASYYAALSPASQKSLALQGGSFDAAQAQAFEQSPHWREAVALRRFDDGGKCDEVSIRSFADYLPLLRNLSALRENC